eukprot:m.16384 g.16384  ORF g.16384 m.16384 type:complete len:311 (-) comp5684_c0_seq2:169-1101(-)
MDAPDLIDLGSSEQPASSSTMKLPFSNSSIDTSRLISFNDEDEPSAQLVETEPEAPLGPEPELLNKRELTKEKEAKLKEEVRLPSFDSMDLEAGEILQQCGPSFHPQMIVMSFAFIMFVMAIVALAVGGILDGRFSSSLAFMILLGQTSLRIPRPPPILVRSPDCPGFCTNIRLVNALYFLALLVPTVAVSLGWSLSARPSRIILSVGQMFMIGGDLTIFILTEDRIRMGVTLGVLVLLFLLLVIMHFDSVSADREIGIFADCVVGLCYAPWMIRNILGSELQNSNMFKRSRKHAVRTNEPQDDDSGLIN